MLAVQTEAGVARITLDEYLHTVYKPDCDFVDGLIEERTLGDMLHSLLQVELAFWFRSHRAEWKIRTMSELRTQVSESRVRLPDVAVAYDDELMGERVRVTPPLIAIEILSPDDRLPRVLLRLEDFWQMGVPHVWLLDPLEKAAYTYTGAGLKLVEASRIAVDGTPIYLDLPELFAELK